MSRSTVAGPDLTAADADAPACAVQPHGLLLVVQEPLLRVVQASTSAGALLQRPLDTLLLSSVADLGGDLDARLRALPAPGAGPGVQTLACSLGVRPALQRFEGVAYRSGAGTLVVELEPACPPPGAAPTVALDAEVLLARLGAAVQAFGAAASVAELATAAARSLQFLVGYHRVMVSELGSDGRGRVIAESLDPVARPAMWPLLGQDDPMTEITPQARQMPWRQGLHLVVDVNAPPATLVPELPPGGHAGDLDCSPLRRPSPAQLECLRRHGVAASVSATLVCEGRLWGVISCHHGQARNLGPTTRAAVALLAEAFATRVLGLAHQTRASVMAEVRRLEHRLLDATSTEGDWHAALLRNHRTLLEPLAAQGALLVNDGRTLGCGQVPTGAARAGLLQWLQAQPPDTPVHCAALEEGHPARRAGVCGVLAVRLSQTEADCLLWLRPEHEGSGTALPWTGSDLDLAAAFGAALSELILQVNAVRLLIAESQLAQLRAAVTGSREAVVLTDGDLQSCHANAAFLQLAQRHGEAPPDLDSLAALFTQPVLARRIFAQLRAEQRSWRGELVLRRADGGELPVSIRASPVPAGDRRLLGTIILFEDLSQTKAAEAARARLESALARAGRASHLPGVRELLGALLTNAGLAAMDINEGGMAGSVPQLLQEVEASTARTSVLLERIQSGDDGVHPAAAGEDPHAAA